MKKAFFFVCFFSLFIVGCESKRGELDRQEQEAGPQTEDVRPVPQSGPEHGAGGR